MRVNERITDNTARRRRRVLAATVAAAIGLSGGWSSPPVAADPGTSSVVGLEAGEQGADVRDVQAALLSHGIDLPGGADGVFGPATEAAVKQVQSEFGLPETGRVDAATAFALGLRTSPVYGLRPGDQGDRVRALQQELADAGHPPRGGVDGIYGEATTASVAALQREHGLAETGTVNAATAAVFGNVQLRPAVPVADVAGAAADEGANMLGLQVGDRGPAVKRLQSAIMAAGFTVVGGADGIFGALTSAALTSFQSVNGIEPTGVVDEATLAVLRSVEANAGGEDDGHDPTVSASSGDTSPLVGLKYGARGSDVEALQRALEAAGHRPFGGVDGIFGPATRSALESFQAEQGLEVTGQVDEATASALRSGGGAASSMVGLRAGSVGATVVELQTALEAAGFRPRGGADGIFGPATAQALQAFQSNQGLEATGVVDAATAAALASPSPSAARSGGNGDASVGFPVFGEKGERVAQLQTRLVEAGIELRGGVDGSFGGATVNAVMEFQRRHGVRVTGRVNAATAAALGLDAAPAPAAPDVTSVQLDAFPMQGRCHFSDTWHAPRGGGRVHLGVDLIGAEGLAIYAVADGVITKMYHDQPGARAGNALRLTQPDGTYFFYAHLVDFAEGIEVGTRVTAGQVIGYNGTTGSSGTPHLHLEIHPQGGAAINPYPLVKAIDACDVTELRGTG